ncbi:MAG: hypothetical protein RLZZ166_1085, partial [Pseudomonadota bacterium]
GLARKLQIPELVEAYQHGCGVGTAAAESRPTGNLLVNQQVCTQCLRSLIAPDPGRLAQKVSRTHAKVGLSRPAQVTQALDLPIMTSIHLNAVGPVNETKKTLKLVIAIGPSSHDV